MAEKVIMPKQGLQMTEGTISDWHVHEGGKVEIDQPLFDIETDKVVMTIYADRPGTLLKILVQKGITVPVAETVAIIGEPNEDLTEILNGINNDRETAVKQFDQSCTTGQTEYDPIRMTVNITPSTSEVYISPRARMLAEESGINYKNITGSAPDGTITEQDIINAIESTPKATPLARKIASESHIDLKDINATGPHGKIIRDDVEKALIEHISKSDLIPMNAMRKTIAKRMKQSLNENAQATHRISVHKDKAKILSESLDKTISYNDIIISATARALKNHPYMNTEMTDAGIRYKNYINIGIAVALKNGLIVPVIRDADKKTVTRIAEETKGIVKKAESGALLPDEYTGSCFTVSNLGMYGLEEFTAIINPPEAGILAVGAITDTPVAVNDKVVILPVMKLTLSYDHRIIDGAPAAQFLVQVKEYLENPALLYEENDIRK